MTLSAPSWQNFIMTRMDLTTRGRFLYFSFPFGLSRYIFVLIQNSFKLVCHHSSATCDWQFNRYVLDPFNCPGLLLSTLLKQSTIFEKAVGQQKSGFQMNNCSSEEASETQEYLLLSVCMAVNSTVAGMLHPLYQVLYCPAVWLYY